MAANDVALGEGPSRDNIDGGVAVTLAAAGGVIKFGNAGSV